MVMVRMIPAFPSDPVWKPGVELPEQPDGQLKVKSYDKGGKLQLAGKIQPVTCFFK